MSNVTVIDVFDNRDKIKDSIKLGVKFAIEKVNKDNLTEVLGKYLSAGDLLVDLAYEISTLKMLEWCRAHDVCYINAALEVDEPYKNAQTTDVRQFTLYHRHQELEKQIKKWGKNNGPTAVIEHGANPGLVSHFVKLALLHIAQKVITEKPLENPARTERLKALMAERDFPKLSMELGVKVIHVSERDTQVTDKPKLPGEFCNTWSPLGFYQEGVAPAELGWGTHEKELPENGIMFDDGAKSSICLKTKGINTLVRSWVPSPHDSGDILGMVVRHGESYTIPQALSVYDDKGECVYRPTCHYAYLPTDAAMNSLHEVRMRGYKPQPKTRVLKDEITSGQDILGCLLMGHDFNSWWIGSLLDINESRELVPHQSATIVQVGIGFATALQWILANPRKGVCVPDDLPFDEIIREALPYLGPFISVPVDWTPLKAAAREAPMEYRSGVLPGVEAKVGDEWQFNSFLVK
jgi:homospermidine synthase